MMPVNAHTHAQGTGTAKPAWNTTGKPAPEQIAAKPAKKPKNSWQNLKITVDVPHVFVVFYYYKITQLGRLADGKSRNEIHFKSL